MIDEIIKLLEVKDENGNFALDVKEVMDAQGKSSNAVYASRKGDCKLDKLTAFDKIKELIKKGEQKGLTITGNKFNVLASLDGLLEDEKVYEVKHREV